MQMQKSRCRCENTKMVQPNMSTFMHEQETTGSQSTAQHIAFAKLEWQNNTFVCFILGAQTAHQMPMPCKFDLDLEHDHNHNHNTNAKPQFLSNSNFQLALARAKKCRKPCKAHHATPGHSTKDTHSNGDTPPNVSPTQLPTAQMLKCQMHNQTAKCSTAKCTAATCTTENKTPATFNKITNNKQTRPTQVDGMAWHVYLYLNDAAFYFL